MTKRFIVGTTNLSEEEEKQFIKFLASNDVRWWHWLPNFWLLKSSADIIDCEKIRDAIARRCLVMEVEGDLDWAVIGGKNAKGKDFSDWLKGTWPND